MIDQSTGKECPLTWTSSGSESLSCCASQGPSSAPTKPMAVDTTSPPRAPPAMAFPIAPHTAAITMRMMSAGTDVFIRSPLLVDFVHLLLAAARDGDHDPGSD